MFSDLYFECVFHSFSLSKNHQKTLLSWGWVLSPALSHLVLSSKMQLSKITKYLADYRAVVLKGAVLTTNQRLHIYRIIKFLENEEKIKHRSNLKRNRN